MKYEDLPKSNDLPPISSMSIANLFTIEIKNNRYEFRSNKTVIIIGGENATQELYDMHKISTNDSWASLSNAYYGTTDLWWIICKFNKISNPNILPENGKIILIPKQEIVNVVISSIRKSGS